MVNLMQLPNQTTLAAAGVNWLPQHHNTYSFIDPQKHDLRGKHVLIIGGSQGIGRAIVLSYAAAGASCIAIAARSDLSGVVEEAESVATKAGRSKPKLIALQMDVSDKTSVDAAAEKVKEEIEYLDIIVNNAAVIEKPALITDIDPDKWWKVWEVNVKGPFLVLHYFLPLLLAAGPDRGDKTFIAVSSVGAHLVMPGRSAYQASKLALLRIAEFVDAEYGDKGVLAYSVHPGSVFTAMGEILGVDKKVLPDEPELPGDAIVWLTSQKREWLAGRYVSCNWDMEGLEKRRDEIIEKDLLKVRLSV